METQCSHQDVTIKEFCDWLDGSANDSSPLSRFAREGNSCYIDYKYMKDMFEDHAHIFEEGGKKVSCSAYTHVFEGCSSQKGTF